ncbi:MAG: hypothetical protein HY540_02840 [Deltaproteobacteria bacterium]|nr:hypothetical protein [Deltaproteobacteria bacterium]
MEKALQVLNEMEQHGVIEKYALGGAIALLFYTEPVLTYDLDVFVFLPQEKQNRLLISLEPIYAYLKSKGYFSHKEHVHIEGIAVQFIPVYNELIEEAVKKAKKLKYNKTTVRVLSLEYLIAIMVQTGRPKDRMRIGAIFEQVKIKEKIFVEILKRHQLYDQWKGLKS